MMAGFMNVRGQVEYVAELVWFHIRPSDLPVVAGVNLLYIWLL